MKNILYSIVILLMSSIINTSFSQEYNVFNDEMVEVNYITSVTNIKENIFYLGLQFQLKPGWKIYWRQPGDSGMPPELNYSESKNLKSFKIKWPYPLKEYEAANLLTNVYKGKVILPIEVSAIDTKKLLQINSVLKFQVCKDICIPLKTNLFIKIDAGKAKFTKDFFQIEKALAKVPRDYKSAGINYVVLNKSSEKSLILNIESAIEFPQGSLEVFLEDKTEFIKINNITLLKNDKYNISAKLDLEKSIDSLNSLDIVLVKGNLAALKKSLTIESNTINSIYLVLLIAFLGGLILNFMPCVLPVLFLKVSRILSNNYNDNTSIRSNFLLTTIGIISSFIFLAFITLLIKHITGQVGWGIQFQQPIFLFFLIFVLIIFSLSFFDLININLPNKLNASINKYLYNKKDGLAFFEGALATLLATPCSAPFLGSAISFALSSNFYITIVVFTMLGIGMSFPYLLLIAFPSLVLYLPRPGKWMIYLRYLLGVGLILTAAWLGYVCISIIGIITFAYIFSSMIIFIFIVKRAYFKIHFLVLISILLLGNIYFSYNTNFFEKKALIFSNDGSWVEFNNIDLLNYISEGNIVFIDITADWCVTCKVNKLLVINSNEFRDLIKNNNVILMRGDWTKPNSEISNFLLMANRYGIPFNALYNYDHPKGIIFSELLTIKEIKQGLYKMHSSYAE